MNDERIQIYLAEFRELRTESEGRSRFQQALAALNITSIATVFGIALSSSGGERWVPYILLVIPILSSLLSLLHLNHHFTNSLIGLYIRDVISPKLRELTGDAGMMNWETWTREIPWKYQTPREITFVFGAIALYIFPGIIALYGTFGIAFQSGGWITGTWITGAALTLVSLIMWAYRYFFWSGGNNKESGQKGEPPANGPAPAPPPG